MRAILVFFGPCLWSHVLLVFGISRNVQPAAGGHVFFLHVLAPSLLSLEQLSRLRGFASSWLCGSVKVLVWRRLSRDVTNLFLRNPVLEEKMLPGRCGNPIFDD